MTGYKIMMYCQDSLGLGHLRRATNIAWNVYHLDPDADVLIVADSPVAPFFPVPPTCDVVKLPTLVKVDAGQWKSPLDGVLELERIRSLRVDLLRSISEEFRPDTILIDHLAHGAMGELEPMIEAVSTRGGVHLVLGLRDILGDPEAIQTQWQREGVTDLIAQSYDQVLVYGTKEIFDLPTVHQFDESIAKKTTFCGYVIQIADQTAAVSPRERSSVLVMAGGGHDGDRIMTAAVESLDHFDSSADLDFTILTGPFLSSEQSATLRRRAAGHRVNFERARALTLADLDATDLVVSMCGYNTMAEVLAAQKPAVVVPRLGPSLEQTMRATLFDERGLIQAILDKEIAPDHFARCVEAELDKEALPKAIPTTGGPAAALALLQRDPATLGLNV